MRCVKYSRVVGIHALCRTMKKTPATIRRHFWPMLSLPIHRHLRMFTVQRSWGFLFISCSRAHNCFDPWSSAAYMTRMPWSPTQAFPHPLANMQSSSLGTRFTNYLSYMLLEELIWEGLGDTINSFRRQTLGLPYIDRSSGPNLVSRLQIPYTYCWHALKTAHFKYYC